jgi:hypothetical protein
MEAKLFYVFLTILSLIVVGYGHYGLTTLKSDCEIVDELHPQREFWNNEIDVTKNEKIISTTTGMGYGIIIFLFMLGIINLIYKNNQSCLRIIYTILIIITLFLVIISSFLINQSQSFDNNCSLQAKEQSNVIYGILGSGIGMLIFSLLYISSHSVTKNLIITVFTSIILLSQSIVMVMNSNNCKMDKNSTFAQKTYNTVGYTIATFSVLFIIFTVVYFFVKMKKGNNEIKTDGLETLLKNVIKK